MLHASTFDAARRNISRWAGTALLANKTDGAVYLPSQGIPVTDLIHPVICLTFLFLRSKFPPNFAYLFPAVYSGSSILFWTSLSAVIIT